MSYGYKLKEFVREYIPTPREFGKHLVLRVIPTLAGLYVGFNVVEKLISFDEVKEITELEIAKQQYLIMPSKYNSDRTWIRDTNRTNQITYVPLSYHRSLQNKNQKAEQDKLEERIREALNKKH
jgi:hypothetical protein